MNGLEVALLAIGFLDLFGVSMVITCLPSHLSKLGVSGFNLGMFLSIYGAIQLFSSSFMGIISDAYGRRFILKICTFCTAIGYFAMAIAPNFAWLCVARIFVGIFKHTLTLSTAVLSIHVTGTSRDRIMGFFNSMGSLGFLIGPPFGGWLFDNYDFKAVGGICGAAFLLIFVLLQLVPSTEAPGQAKQHSRSRPSGLGLQQILSMWDLYALQVLMGASVMIFRTNFSTAMKGRFEAPVLLTGLIISSGALSGVIGGACAGFVMRLYNRNYLRLVLHSCTSRALSMLGCSLAPNLPIFVVMQLPLSFSNTACKEAMTPMFISRLSNQADVGKVLGFGQSLLSFARLVTPFIGSVAMEWSIRAPAFVGTFFAFLSILLCLNAWRSSRRQRSHVD